MPVTGDRPRSGSSPLTRGKQRSAAMSLIRKGLIPAHAGKTFWKASASSLSGAHPRSRGENPRVPEPLPQGEGSSPLTRGKRSRRYWRGRRTGLIPAHAGKTSRRVCRSRRIWAHPRSRGENDDWLSSSEAAAGSSPLTRGKHPFPAIARFLLGLIPAHAGKTRRPGAPSGPAGAHPRSRGENSPQA